MRGLWRTEDGWAIGIGWFLALVGALLYRPAIDDETAQRLRELDQQLEDAADGAPFKTLRWHEISDAKAKAKKPKLETAQEVKSWLPKLAGWRSDPWESIVLGEEAAGSRRADRAAAVEEARAKERELRLLAEQREAAAKEAGFEDSERNDAAKDAIWEYRGALAERKAAEKKAGVTAHDLRLPLLVFGVAMALLLGVGMLFLPAGGRAFAQGFLFVYALAIVAYVLAAQADFKSLGIGYAAWAILLGLIVSNTVGVPGWVKPAVQTEYFIKTGLVLLGVEILLGKIWVIGLPGLFVAWVVTPVVFVSTYLFGQKVLKMRSRSLNLTLSADMSVCGVSAAIATAAACKAKKEELTLAVGISLVFTSIMMVVLPNVILALDMDHVLGGAWIGGTIDATGAVAAAGAFLSDQALYVAATIKMIQNILIGVIAFAVAVFWVTKVERNATGQRPSLWEVWRRFPKFVFGFLGASVVFSLIYQQLGPDMGEAYIQNGVISGWTKGLRGWLFCLAFVSIGLATNFRELGGVLKDGKALVLYLCGQCLNLALTLGAAYLMFKVIFTDLVEQL